MASLKRVPILTEEEQSVIDRAHNEERRFLAEKEVRKAVLAIRTTIKNEELRLKKRYKWLEHQSLLGLGCFVLSVAALLLVGILYMKRVIHWSLAIPLLALPGSILHELEHDLIHNLYFKGKRWVQDIMFTVIWFVKLSVPPWYRKIIHLRHHVVSGQKEDIEERLIGIGKPLSLARWLLTLDPAMTILVLDDIEDDNKNDFSKAYLKLISLPTVIPFTILLHIFLNYLRLVNGLTFTQYDPALLLPLWAWPYVRDLAILLILPNVLRQACLNLIASYSHYYGDVPEHHIYYQNQVLDHWLLWPLQMFCFNFGATHIIHHYIPNQTFYLRQMLARKAIDCMVKYGVRRNDFGIIRRNNRYYSDDEASDDIPAVKAQ